MADLQAVTIPLKEIARIQIYINSPRKTLAAVKKATGADYLLNGTLYNLSLIHISSSTYANATLRMGAWMWRICAGSTSCTKSTTRWAATAIWTNSSPRWTSCR